VTAGPTEPGFLPLRAASAADSVRFRAIYHEALPPSERKSDAAIAALGDRADYSVELLMLDGDVAGFLIVYRAQDHAMSLLEYAAVDATRRNAGLGGTLLEHALSLSQGRAMLVEVDSDRDALAADHQLRTRRKQFYARHGCRPLPGIDYVMPVVGDGRPPAMDLLVATTQDSIAKPLLRAWLSDIYVHVYGQPADAPAIDRMIAAAPESISL
jgi:GNAT superfamily N-acetyltransferase